MRPPVASREVLSPVSNSFQVSAVIVNKNEMRDKQHALIFCYSRYDEHLLSLFVKKQQCSLLLCARLRHLSLSAYFTYGQDILVGAVFENFMTRMGVSIFPCSWNLESCLKILLSHNAHNVGLEMTQESYVFPFSLNKQFCRFLF